MPSTTVRRGVAATAAAAPVTAATPANVLPIQPRLFIIDPTFLLTKNHGQAILHRTKTRWYLLNQPVHVATLMIICRHPDTAFVQHFTFGPTGMSSGVISARQTWIPSRGGVADNPAHADL